MANPSPESTTTSPPSASSSPSAPPNPYPPTTSIFILGASVFGLSSAHHLCLAGYTNITVLDRSATLPSPHAASHDLNKIVRAEYGAGHATDDFYTDLALQAIEAWESEGWEGCFRKTGYVRLAKTVEAQAGIARDVAYFSGARAGSPRRRWFPTEAFEALLGSGEEAQKAVPQMRGELLGEEGWKGALNRHAGYALASKAIRVLHRRCVDAGVKFVLGPSGHITELEKSAEGRVTGVCASNGDRHLHPEDQPCLTILAMGAELPRLFPAAATQLTGKSWSVAHLELTPDEAAKLQDSPVVSLGGLGFWIEPVFVPEDTPNGGKGGQHLLKFAAHGGGWTNSDPRSPGSSTERATEQPAVLPPAEPLAVIPASDEQLLRELIRLTLPAHFLSKPFVRKSMCWCADTASSDFVIDFVPSHTDLLVAGADSGHAFKFLPVAGEWVVDVVRKGIQRERRWRWKELGNRSDVGGEDVAWRGASVRNLRGQTMV
ncbi:uncharacterized protein HMPREF1541_07904 [Cyphellophora europaea CBS 101466]|uniref:FAD dependent oxidoreductase domain-containing protein n=1 Tax=Cyphellophora europaea (strain CBS 101466) TaxID=1220924 RepID=W2RKB7_CYPE1|nr:uncharacterized protein HMPREF1541_07904 [Cyphellophora europaea CBS 101466]ETN36917.1 hypothetical protein HMPREF1541_07904 [Cyphellophora europaea CBS 101466]